MRILLKTLKKAGEIGAEKVIDTSTQNDQVGSYNYSMIWQEKNTGSKPSSVWVYPDGRAVPPPTVADWGTLTNTERDELRHWFLTNPVCNIERHPKLYKGDGYDEHGFGGVIYKGVVTGNLFHITGTFTRDSAGNPNPEPTPGS